MTEESVKVSTAVAESNKQPNQLTTEEEDRLQCEANEDSTGSEDLRLFLKELHEKVKEDQQQQQQQQQQFQQSQPYNPVIPSSGQLLPPAYPTGAGEFSIDATSASHYSSSQCNNLKEAEAGLIAYRGNHPHPQHLIQPGNHVVQYQTGPVIEQAYHTSVAEINAQDVVPDGGWGWIVVLGSFCCMVLVDGVCFTYGLLLNPVCPYSSLRAISRDWKSNETGPIRYPRSDRVNHPTVGSCIPISELGEDFNVQERSILLTPGALIVGLYLFLGPIVSALSNQFDFRPVAMVGAIISTIALFSSAFVVNIEQFILTFGILGGIGLSFIYLPAIATVGHWFQQKRPLAVGLALCGSGMGCLIGGQAIPRLIILFTWRGTLIILAAVCFQCLTLILLFRPWDVHFQITQAQKAKRIVREAERRAAALRRAEAERLILEARKRRYLAAVEAAATAQAVGMKKHSLVNNPTLMNNNKSGVYQTTEYRVDPTGGTVGAGGVIVGRRNPAQPGRIHLHINQTRNGRPNKHFLFHQHNRSQPPGFGGDNSRTNAFGGVGSAGHNRSVSNQNAGSGRMASRKRAPSRRVIVYRGSIMQRIIEEKRRQRTISVGSLDGMVITRDNELIAASKITNYDKPLLDPITVQKISENVARKIEAKLSSTALPNLSAISEAIPPPPPTTTGNTGAAVTTSGGNSTVESRAGFRVSLPQIVQEYIQSQLSLSLQQQQQQQSQIQAKLSSSINPLSNNSHPCTSIDQMICSPSALSKLSTANVAVHDFTVHPTINTNESITNVDGITGNIPLTDNTLPVNQSNLPIISGGSIIASNSPVINLSGTGIVPNTIAAVPPGTTTATSIVAPATVVGSGITRLQPLHSMSENVSLRRTTSDASLESRSTSAYGVDPSYAGVDLLDDEMKADIQMLVRKEMSRPQYKKDFFYTGPIRQIDPVNKLSSANHKLSINLPIIPAVVAAAATTTTTDRPNRSSTSFRLPPAILPQDGKQEHCSQTNLSVVNSTNLFSNQFIPPAPCPPIPMNQQSIVYTNIPMAGLSPQFPIPLDNNMNQGLPNVYRERFDSIASQNSNNMEILDSLKFRAANQTGDCEKGYYEGITGTTAIPQPLPPPPTTTATANAVNIQQQQPPLPEDISDFGGDIDIDGDDLGVGIDDGDDVDVGVDVDGCDELNDDCGVDEDDDDDNNADLIDGQLNHQSTLCPKCFQHCNRICQNIFYCCSAWSPLGAFMQDLLSPKLLLSPTFLFFLFSSMTAMLGLVIPFLMLPDLLSEMNWKLEDSGFIISSIGAGNTFGRLFATFYIEKAWSTTYKWADSLWMNNISLLLTSITVFTLPTIRRYYTAVVLVSCGFGLFSAVFVSLKSILVVELIGIDRLTNAFGYLLLFQGCAAAIGPPVAGYLRDKRIESLPPLNIFTADTAPVHNASAIGFLFAGTALLISCLLGCPLRWLSRKEYPSDQPSTTFATYNPNEFLPNHIDPTNFNYESPVLTGDHEYMQLPEYHQGVEINEPGSNRRIDIVDHYPGTPAVAPLSSLAIVDPLRSQANSQLSPCVPPSSVSGVPLPASHHHVILSTAQPTVSPLVVGGGSAGGVAPVSTTTGSYLENNNVPVAGGGGSGNLTASVTDDTVQLVGVSSLKLSASGIPVPVVGGSGGGSVPTPSSVSISLPAQTVEVLEVKEDPGLEPVVEEEEEEEYEDEEEDYPAEGGLVAGGDNSTSLHHQPLDCGLTNNDDSCVGGGGFAGTTTTTTTTTTMGVDNLPATNDPCTSSSSSSSSSTSTTPSLRSGGSSRKDMTTTMTTKHKRRRGTTAATKPTTTTTSPTPIGDVEVSDDCSVTVPSPPEATTTTIPVASTIPTTDAAVSDNTKADDGCNSKEDKDNGDKDENSVHTS